MRTLLLLFILIGAFACKKNGNDKDQESTKQPVLKFRVNGVLYDWTPSVSRQDTSKRYLVTLYHYYLLGRPDVYRLGGAEIEADQFSTLSFDITRDSLITTKTYSYAGEATLDAAGITLGMPIGRNGPYRMYGTTLDSDYATVTVTKIQNGFVSGTFSAWLSNDNNIYDRVRITEGVFENIKIEER